jgi:predicted ATPase/DNA-binding winged helix-turn-helix (wHTH) protein
MSRRVGPAFPLNVASPRERADGIAYDDAIIFGQFRLLPAERRLERDGVPLRIGGRPLDILIVLVGRAPEIVEKRDLMAKVWPDVAIDEGSLRFHVNRLRKVLGESGKDGRCIVNVAGRGYCFAAPISPRAVPNAHAPPRWPLSTAQLPSRMVRVLGRDGDMRTISADVLSYRFVSIVGSGGVGKTTVAVSVAHELLHDFDGDVHFIDLGRLSDASVVLTSVASSIGLSIRSQDLLPDLIAFLRNRRLLVVIDNCEHVIHPVAELVEQCISETTEVHIIATSREPLRVKGEHVYRLPPLGYPLEGSELSAGLAMQYPAVQYFVERVIGSGYPLELNDHNTGSVGEICRRLGGIPLAMDLVAPRVGAFGVEELKRLLECQFGLSWCGRRTALPRHQTLRSTLDWSYNLLTDRDRKVHRRLSVFVGQFQLDAAQAVATDNTVDLEQVVDAVASLVTKSLVIIENGEPSAHYRLHDITRAYAIDKLREAGEFNFTARKHAFFYRDALRTFRYDSINPAIATAKPATRGYVSNVRAALGWAFSETGDVLLATELAAASGPLLLATSLLVECRLWSERGIAGLEGGAGADQRKLELRTSFALSQMFTTGNSDEVRSALEEALNLAETLQDIYQQLRLHACLVIFMVRIGNFDAALSFAQRSEMVAIELADHEAIKSANWLLCISYHCIGNHALAQVHGEAALRYPTATDSEPRAQPGYDTRILALTALARSLWIEGQGKRAITIVRQLVEEAAVTMHPVSLCMGLLCAATICIWAEELQIADDIIGGVVAVASKNLLSPYQTLASGIRAQIVLKRGDTQAGVKLLQAWLATLLTHRQRTLASELSISLADGLARLGRVAEGLALINEEIVRVGDLERSYAGPELLRIKGELLSRASEQARENAEDWLKRAVCCARLQSAAAWELRAATSLSSFYRAKGMLAEAEASLMSVDQRSDVCANSPDFTAAARALSDFSRVLACAAERDRKPA